VDFLQHQCLLVDPVANCLVSSLAASVAADVNSQLPPQPSLATFPTVDMSQPFDVWLAALLREFDYVITFKTLPPLPAKNDVFHHIKTSVLPICSKFRHLDEENLRAAKLEFEQLEKDGVVHRSNSPWALPLQKADGSWRTCSDFRRINLVTQLIPIICPTCWILPMLQLGTRSSTKLN
jgi:hypothetical protein